MRRRSDQIDRAFDAFLGDLGGGGQLELATPKVISAVDRLSDQIEAARLAMLLKKGNRKICFTTRSWRLRRRRRSASGPVVSRRASMHVPRSPPSRRREGR